MRFKIKEIAEINKSSITTKEIPHIVKYLDTANITMGKIDTIVSLQNNIDKIPSRARRKVQTGDIIYSTVRPNQLHYGFISESLKHIIVSTGFAVITPKTELIEPYYLYCLLSQQEVSDYLQGIAENSTTAYPSIRPSDIGEIEIDVPSMKQQKSIAHLIKSIDDKQTVNAKIIEHLENIAGTLFKRWFIDFEFPNEDGQPYKSSGGLMKQDGDLILPVGWHSALIGEECKIIRGASPRPIQDFMVKEGRPWVKISDANSCITCYIHNTKEFIKSEGISKSRTVVPGTLILSNSATPGIPKIMDILASVHDGWLIFDEYKRVDKYYMYLLLVNERERLLSLSNGSVFRNLKTDILKSYPIVVPDKRVLREFQNIIRPIFEAILESSREIRHLGKLRDTLLPKLLSGEIEIPEENVVS